MAAEMPRWVKHRSPPLIAAYIDWYWSPQSKLAREVSISTRSWFDWETLSLWVRWKHHLEWFLTRNSGLIYYTCMHANLTCTWNGLWKQELSLLWKPTHTYIKTKQLSSSMEMENENRKKTQYALLFKISLWFYFLLKKIHW